MTGGIVAGLNHVMHKVKVPLATNNDGENPPRKKNNYERTKKRLL